MNAIPSPKRRGHQVRTVLGSIAVIGCVFGLLAGIAYVKDQQINAAMAVLPPPEMPVAVTFATAEEIKFRRSSVVVGNVLASESIALQNELTGLVTSVAMVPGGTVKLGDVLVQLDDRTEKAQSKSAQAARKLAESAVQRSRKLSLANANSASELDIAEAELTRAEAMLDELKVLIDRKQLRAPFDARVGLFDLHIGQYLVEGTQITMLEGIADYLNIDFEMPAHVADSITIGDEVELRIDELSDPLVAKIVAIDSAANAVSRSLKARARLANPPLELQPNDSVRVTIFYGEPIPARSVPATAVRRGPSGMVAFVAREVEGVVRAQARDVTVAGGAGTLVNVIEGIDANERVVADGSFKVVDKAMLVDAMAAPSADTFKAEATSPSSETSTR